MHYYRCAICGRYVTQQACCGHSDTCVDCSPSTAVSALNIPVLRTKLLYLLFEELGLISEFNNGPN